MHVYRQTQTHFYKRMLSVDEGLNPILPENGYASPAYLLDATTSDILGMMYGVALTIRACPSHSQLAPIPGLTFITSANNFNNIDATQL